MLKIILLFSFTFIFAFNLDQEIENITKLPPEQKYIALNKLKQKILKQKKAKREEMIKKLLLHYHINNTPSESIIKDDK
jgi:hypothetical protein